MPDRDFFAFCTSLSRPQLRAIGELSWVRHLKEGEVLYRPGDPGNALFIVNKGEVEMVASGGGVTPLKRGQVVGDVEAFSELPRTHLVHSPGGASVQCFPRANFHQLVRSVPPFFCYLCEQMAFRVLQAHDQTNHFDQNAPLSGRISHFDLTTVHQTIANSGQTGQLSIKDEQAETIGAFYFESGRPAAGQFEHLTGQEAFWQLFLNEGLSGTFSFSVGDSSMTNWIESGEIARSTGDMLISALQFRDELNSLKNELNPPAGAKLTPQSPTLHWNLGAPEGLRPLAHRIWDLVTRKPQSIGDVYRQCSVCELKIYQVVNQLVTQQLISFD